ncbi:MAG TPA: hypothetical protein VGC95_11215 [Chitinophagaceae bacterium]
MASSRPGNQKKKIAPARSIKSPKKSAAAKPATGRKKITIKYRDKSPGQPELKVIFERIRDLMKPYSGGTMEESGGDKGKFILVSKKPVEIFGRKRDELWFASSLVQKGYVGFYFMPVYMNAPLQKKLHPDLLKCLKGKACFHIRTNDEGLLSHIREALRAGYEDWKKREWI